jgi:type II secretory pathway pseudopilin PulG
MEIVAAITLLSITSALMLPKVSSVRASYQANDRARTVASVVAAIRSRAIAEQRDYRLVMASGSAYRLQVWDGIQWLTAVTKEAMTDTAVRVDGSDTATITFSRKGRIDAPRTVTIGHGERSRAFQLLASGMIWWRPSHAVEQPTYDEPTEEPTYEDPYAQTF